jgi:type IV pilus assembly protein PilQ
MENYFNSVRRILRLVFITAAILPFGANAEVASGDANGIQTISAGPSVGGKIVLKIGLKSALPNQPAAFTINTPPRIAFDFPNTTNDLGKSIQSFSEGDLRSVNIVQAGNRTRLVVNLNQMLKYDTQIDGNNVLITLQAKESSAGSLAAVTTTRFAEAKPSSQPHSLRDVDFRRGKNGEGRVEIDLSDSSVGIDIKQQGKSLLVDFAQTNLPRNLQRKLDVVDFGTPVQLIDATPQGENTRLVIEPKGSWEYAAYQTDNKFIIEIKPVVEDTSKLTKGSRNTYAGEKLSLNFQNISTREALNVIADFTNLNMVISDTVTGNLTLRLKDVPWDQALQIILDSRGLLQEKEGNVIMVAPGDEINARQKDKLTSQKAIRDLEPLQTEAFPLSYAKVADVKSVLAGALNIAVAAPLVAGAAGAGAAAGTNNPVSESVAFDTRTNTMYVTASLSKLERVREIVKKLDIPIRQVLIEARFVEATTSYNAIIGGKLGYTGPAVASGSGSPIGGTGVSGLLTGAGVNNTGFVSGQGGSVNVSLFNALATKTLSLELNASEVDGTTKSIASPRIMTGDSTPATIKSGVQIPYTTPGGTLGGAATVSFADAVLGITVTPKITPDDRIMMTVDLHDDTVGSLYGGIPSINSKEVTTTILVENGGTVVIGGIYTQELVDTVAKVPLLGDIPILGWLFKNDTKQDTKSELLVFITPKILKDSLNLN